MSDRVCYIDIDGVCLPFGGANGVNRTDFSADAIEALRVLKDRGYLLILHSSWRHVDELYAEADDTFAAAGLTLAGCVDRQEPSKAKAIAMHLLDWFEDGFPADVLIIDDDDVSVPGCRSIRPDFRVGLRVADLEGGAT